jgi:hypothetical protein
MDGRLRNPQRRQVVDRKIGRNAEIARPIDNPVSIAPNAVKDASLFNCNPMPARRTIGMHLRYRKLGQTSGIFHRDAPTGTQIAIIIEYPGKFTSGSLAAMAHALQYLV